MTEEKKVCGTSDQINVTVARHADHLSPEISETLSLPKKQRLLQERSWTRTVPFKHWHVYVKPSDSVGSIYTPGTYHLQTGALTKRVVKPRCRLFTVDDGMLAGPPRFLVERHNEEAERKAAVTAEKKRDGLPENIVNLKDLADSTWLREKNLKKRALRWKELSIRDKKGRITKKKLDREVMRGRCVS